MSDYSGVFLKARFSVLKSSLSFVFTFLFSLQVLSADKKFPVSPDLVITPGTLCTTPSQYRYPEKIPYCVRNVDSSTKAEIFKEYDSKLGFETTQMERSQFKIDHFIPLCMGGSNDKENLWPQHKTIYEKTDLLEQQACEKMALGRLKQADAVELIREAKLSLHKAEDVLDYVQAL